MKTRTATRTHEPPVVATALDTTRIHEPKAPIMRTRSGTHETPVVLGQHILVI